MDNLEYFCPLGELYQSGWQQVVQPYHGWVGLDHNHISEKQHLAGQRRIYRQLHEMESEQRRSGYIALGNIHECRQHGYSAIHIAQWTGHTTACRNSFGHGVRKMLYRDPTFWNGNNGVVVLQQLPEWYG